MRHHIFSVTHKTWETPDGKHHWDVDLQKNGIPFKWPWGRPDGWHGSAKSAKRADRKLQKALRQASERACRRQLEANAEETVIYPCEDS